MPGGTQKSSRRGLIRRILSKEESSEEPPPCPAPTATAGGQARDPPPSHLRDPPPSVLRAFLSLFTMAFARHNLKLAEVQGSAELGNRLREEYTNLGILAAFTGAIVFSELYSFPVLMKDAEWEAFNRAEGLSEAVLIITMVGFVLMITSLLLSIANLMVIDVMPDTVIAEYFSRVTWPARMPYISLVFGMIFWCAATALSAPFIFGTTVGLSLMVQVWVAVMIVVVGCTHLVYVADSIYFRGVNLGAGGTDQSAPTT